MFMDMTLPQDQVGFLLRAGEPSELQPVSASWIEHQVRRFGEIETEWYQYGRRPLDALDWVRQNAYRIKKRVFVG